MQKKKNVVSTLHFTRIFPYFRVLGLGGEGTVRAFRFLRLGGEGKV